MLAADGVVLRVADVRSTAAERVRDEFNATIVPVETVMYEDVDVFAPCALGAVLNEHTIGKIQARIVAGAANNQLAKDADGAALQPLRSSMRRTMSSMPAASSASRANITAAPAKRR